ncbi:MAG: Gfo/Idh/MocA family oxidoreductase [Anaerolineales bacterium]|nr:Gfo/Idh/MocA family oxidoreductase [Anaerolineales bacterium]
MSDALRLGIVGCGSIADPIAKLTRLTRGMRVTAYCDVNLECANRLATKYGGGAVFGNFIEMLEKEALDAIYLAVPHHLHYTMICEALEKGLPTLTEKPITRTLAEGIAVANISEEKGIPVGVNYQYRYDRGCYALAQHVWNGTLGRIFYARINLAWHREDAYFKHSAWHKSIAQAGGGTLITQASHLIDVVLWALGATPKFVYGQTAKNRFKDVEVEDTALGTITLEDGCMVQIASSMAATPEQAVTIELYGEKGTAIYSDKPRPYLRLIGVNAQRVAPPLVGVHALHRSIKGFRNWLLKDEPYLTPARASLPALAVVEAFYRSAESGMREWVETDY